MPAPSESVPTKALPEIDQLRQAIQDEYEVVAAEPGRGFHFHTGQPLAQIVGYEEEWLAGIPATHSA